MKVRRFRFYAQREDLQAILEEFQSKLDVYYVPTYSDEGPVFFKDAASLTWELIFSAPIRLIGRSSHFQEQPPAPGKNTDGETMRRKGYDTLPFVTKI